MDRVKKIPSNIALFSGLISILLVVILSRGFHQFLGGTKKVILSLLFGITALVLSKIQSKKMVDKVTKAALWCSIIGIILATIKGMFIIVG